MSTLVVIDVGVLPGTIPNGDILSMKFANQIPDQIFFLLAYPLNILNLCKYHFHVILISLNTSGVRN